MESIKIGTYKNTDQRLIMALSVDPKYVSVCALLCEDRTLPVPET
jgi:hypothetical protein